MARPLRIEEPGMWYHVMNRGNAGAVIFHHENDYRRFLDKLLKSCELFNVEIHAYAVMVNHFHLFLRTREANLGRFMQRFLTSFTISYNLKHERFGHLFQGRYKAIVVDSNAYGTKVSRYIDLNPVRIARLENTLLKEKRRILRAYPWSSYRAHIGLAQSPHPLMLNDVIERFGVGQAEQFENYRKFVEQGLSKELENPFDDVVAQAVLGDDAFVERMRETVSVTRYRDRTAKGSAEKLLSITLESVIQAVAAEYSVSVEDISRQHSPSREARRVALWLASQVCLGRMSLTEIGQHFGGIGVSGVARVRDRVEARKGSNRRLRKRLEKLERAIAYA